MDTLNYVALSHQMALQRQMAVISNNIANMNTAGYKREEALFQSYLENMKSAPARSARSVAFVIDQGMTRDLTQGEFTLTDDPLNAAINGDGFFTVRTPEGQIAYTRNGKFRLDGEGFLVTAEGAQVLNTEGEPIQFAVDDSDIAIAQDGTISTKNGVVGRIAITEFENPYLLTKIGGTYLTGEGGRILPANQVHLKSGVIEASNVQAIKEVAEMTELMRAYQATARIIDRYNDIRQQGIERLARVQ
ncbi:flagellar basal-body rod protein FlgF [Pedomonas sp. V897]|uniref:flagellar basal-body rod protein FlgF n=1 Tax=Pedomonas sp. V897 TaxID=3446482 RepID=UPI003EE3C37F